jgi:hypothetical protein
VSDGIICEFQDLRPVGAVGSAINQTRQSRASQPGILASSAERIAASRSLARCLTLSLLS